MIEEKGESNPRSRSLENRDAVSQHRGLARGWLVVNPLGVIEPMVGRKRAPLSAVASRYLGLISIFPVIYIELE